MNVKVIDRSANVLKSVNGLLKNDVLVGIAGGTTARTPEDGEPAGITNAALGYIHDNGSPARNIPARPFMRPGIENAKDGIAAALKAGALAAMDGKSPLSSQTKAGLLAENGIKAKITDGPFEPLGARTLAARRRRGRTGDKPLIDTGQLRRSITHVIRPKGE